MSFLEPDKSRNQTPWKFGVWTFYANIPESIHDEKIINDAKKIVDKGLPQRFGPHGTHYYSFVTREYVLNLILNFYEKNKYFPQGDICIVDQWYWNSYVFKNRKDARNYIAGTLDSFTSFEKS